MHLLEAIREYCQQHALLEPRDGSGVVLELLFDTQVIKLDYRPETQTLFLHAPLGTPELTRQESAALHRRLLSVNLLGSQLGDACFCIDKTTGNLELQLRVEASSIDSPALLDAALNTHFARAQYSSEHLLATLTPSTTPEAAPPANHVWA